MSKNIRSIIALLVIVYCLNFFSLILIFKLGTPDLIDRMEASLNGIIMFILGFYFSANHQPQPNSQHTEVKTETITDASNNNKGIS